MSGKQGILIVIEGVNGSGKTTIINEVKKQLEVSRIPAAFYKFPDRNGENGKKINDYLTGIIKIDSKYEILNMFAENRRAIKDKIYEDLQSGKVVMCDRYVFSAIAYQIPSHINDIEKIVNYCNVIGHFDKEMPMPTMTYLIDGDHLLKRGIVNREIFHHTGSIAKQLKSKLFNVINYYTKDFLLLKNAEGHVNEITNFIFYDIVSMIEQKNSKF